MGKKIFVEDAEKRHLCKVFKCSRMLVWKALNFKSDSELARKIRYVALSQLGGTASEDLQKSVVIDTNHDEVERTMPQTFGPRVKLLFYKDTNEAVVFVDGKVYRKEVCNTVCELMHLQGEVTMKAMSL